MDAFAARMANVLVGNADGAPTLEFTMDGPTMVFAREAWICVCGGAFPLTVDDEARPLWAVVHVPAGATVRIGAAREGYRGYFAVAGGLQLDEPVLGSASMYPRARGFAGLAGRPLAAGDVLPHGDTDAAIARRAAAMAHARLTLSARMRPAYAAKVVRCFPGAEYARFSSAQRHAFAAEPWTVSAQSDRMGVRLSGATPLTLPAAAGTDGPADRATSAGSMPSAPAAFGNIQVPPSGEPIVLAADGQTIGGYPRIAQVAAVDLPILAQARPGDRLHFQWITVADADQLLDELELDVARLHHTLATLRG
jgi:antagonist of KipI